MKDIRSSEGEYLFYHPISIVLPSLPGIDGIVSAGLVASFDRSLVESWLHHLFGPVDLDYQSSDAAIGYVLKGALRCENGKKIQIDLDSPLIDIYDTNSNLIYRQVLAEPNVQHYKKLFDIAGLEVGNHGRS